MHAELHDIAKNDTPNIYQELLDGLTPECVAFRPTNHFSSIAWDIWHITRIEDAISNILIADTEQVLTKEKDSIWLLNFWGNKTVSVLLTMPITRHQMVHINDCFKIKRIYQKKYA